MYNSVVSDTTHGSIFFPHLKTQVKSAASEINAKPQAVLVQDSITVQPMTTKTIAAFVDYPSEWHAAGTVAPPGGNLPKQRVCYYPIQYQR